MINPFNDFKSISKIWNKSSFYFTKGNTLFIFEITEDTIQWFIDFGHVYQNYISQVVLCSTFPGVDNTSPYIKHLEDVLEREVNEDMTFKYVLYHNKKGGYEKKFTYGGIPGEYLILSYIIDPGARRADIVVRDEKGYTIYYSGVNEGKNVSTVLDNLKTVNIVNSSYLILNMYNKDFIYNLGGLSKELRWQALSKLLNIPWRCTVIGLPDIDTDDYFTAKIKEKTMLGNNGVGNNIFETFEFGNELKKH